MSLFKVRDFWSFDLDRLKENSNDSQSSTSNIENRASVSPVVDCAESGKTQFIVDVGRFNSIGEQDVFVCGDLDGHIYIVQVPDSDQRKFIKIADDGLDSNPEKKSGDVDQRQLLAAKSLDMLLCDLKCGFFTSALKQSIAVLSSNKLLFLTVKVNQVDLITGDDMFNPNKSKRVPLFERGLMSHELEVDMKLDLLVGELAFGLILLDSHSDSCLINLQKDSKKRRTAKDSDSISSQDSNESNSQVRQKMKGACKQVVQQLHLPQRDKVVIRYANQFVFSIIDNKKVVGHFRLSTPSEPVDSDVKANQTNQADQKLDLLGQCFGSMPMAHLITRPNWSQLSLVISLSDHFIYCLPIDKLTSQARQRVVNRVALDLLSSNRVDSTNNRPPAIKQETSVDPLIEINLDSLCDWHQELNSLPIQMQGVRRQARGQSGETILIGQLLVMSRYSLDMFSSSGEHVWHQRFETPLIHFYSYCIESLASNQQVGKENQTMLLGNSKRVPSEATPNSMDVAGNNQKVRMRDQVISLVCTGALRDDRSSLTILKDDRMSWSAALSSRPLQMWRFNLSRISGLIAVLDVESGHLIVSYLGTNMKRWTSSEIDERSSVTNDNLNSTGNLIELERLNEPLFTEASWTGDLSKEDQRERLQIANRIELGPSDGIVNVSTSIRLDPSSTSVLHNITLTYEFDDLFEFELINDSASSQAIERLARGVVELKLGNCWPDRREPLKIEASFSLPTASSNKLTGTAAMEQHENQNSARSYVDSNLMPRSLRVQQHLTFNQTHSGLLCQKTSFLLPISVVARLNHIDYTCGNNQDLDDVLNNLTSYKRSSGQSNDKAAYLHCDLFLILKCDLFMLLHELIEGDLICRGKLQSARPNVDKTESSASSSSEATQEMKLETLENISLLAQSLDCRIRYMSPSPSGMNRQSSEELVQPTMLSIALTLRNSFPDVVETLKRDGEREPVVWVHVCDLSKVEEPDNIVADFIATHMKDWKKFRNPKEDLYERAELSPHESKVLISIESQNPLALIFVLDHMAARTERLSANDKSIDIKLVTGDAHLKPPKELIDDELKSVPRLLAICESLHEAAQLICNSYEKDHKPKIHQLQTDLTREFVGYQAVVDGSLSFAKRLSSLPDELSSNLDDLMEKARHSYQKLMNGLDELGKCKRRDIEFSKLPMAAMIKIQPSTGSELIAWPIFSRTFD